LENAAKQKQKEDLIKQLEQELHDLLDADKAAELTDPDLDGFPGKADPLPPTTHDYDDHHHPGRPGHDATNDPVHHHHHHQGTPHHPHGPPGHHHYDGDIPDDDDHFHRPRLSDDNHDSNDNFNDNDSILESSTQTSSAFSHKDNNKKVDKGTDNMAVPPSDVDDRAERILARLTGKSSKFKSVPNKNKSNHKASPLPRGVVVADTVSSLPPLAANGATISSLGGDARFVRRSAAMATAAQDGVDLVFRRFPSTTTDSSSSTVQKAKKMITPEDDDYSQPEAGAIDSRNNNNKQPDPTLVPDENGEVMPIHTSVARTRSSSDMTSTDESRFVKVADSGRPASSPINKLQAKTRNYIMDNDASKDGPVDAEMRNVVHIFSNTPSSKKQQDQQPTHARPQAMWLEDNFVDPELAR